MKLLRLIERLAHWLALALGVVAMIAVSVLASRPPEKSGAQASFAGADLQKKRLAVFLDGTWNSVDSNTNVWRMRALCAPKSADGKPQLVYYSLGVNGFWGGVFGQGLDNNIRSAYEWLIENYNEGDEIYIFGFSRGAYTARSLAGLVAIDGILKAGSPIGITELFNRYRAGNEESIWQLRDKVKAGEIKTFSREDAWLIKYSHPVDVTMIGVWDTVGSLGISAGNIPGISRPTFSYLQTGLRTHILNGFHALAIDEHRNDFAPTLWDVRRPKDPRAVVAEPRSIDSVEQRWFVGAHANVGGGYTTDLLPQAPLRWIMQKAEAKGLSFRSQVELDGDALTAPIANSYKDFGYGLYSWVSSPLYRVIGREPETGDDGTHTNVNETIDLSVFDRWRTDSSYRPQNLVEWAKRKQVDPAQIANPVRADDPHVTVPH